MHSALLIFLSFFFLFNIPSWAADSYLVNASSSLDIIEHNVCKKVQNTGTVTRMVPTKTSTEWASFYNNPPANTTITSCPVLVQMNKNNINSTSLSVVMPSNVTAGNALIACGAVDYWSNPSLSDNRGNSWSITVSHVDGTLHGKAFCAHAVNVAAGATTVTLNPSGTSYMLLSVFEVSGIKTSSPVDRTGTSFNTLGTGVSVSTSSGLADTCSYIVVWAHDWHNYNTWTAGAGYTNRQLVQMSGGNYIGVMADKNVRTGLSGIQSATLTKSVDAYWQAVIAAYKCQ